VSVMIMVPSATPLALAICVPNVIQPDTVCGHQSVQQRKPLRLLSRQHFFDCPGCHQTTSLTPLPQTPIPTGLLRQVYISSIRTIPGLRGHTLACPPRSTFRNSRVTQLRTKYPVRRSGVKEPSLAAFRIFTPSTTWPQTTPCSALTHLNSRARTRLLRNRPPCFSLRPALP